MGDSKKMILSGLAVAALLIAVMSASFAYFAANVNIDDKIKLNLNLSENKASFIATASGSIDLKVESYMMQQHDASEDNTSNNTEIANKLVANANINVSLTASETGHLSSCSYDLVWVWENDSTNFTEGDGNGNNLSTANGKVNSQEIYPSKYYIRTENNQNYTTDFKEFTIEGIQTHPGTEERPSSGSLFEEKNIDQFEKVENSDEKLYLKKGETISTENNTSVDYEFIIRFYNLPNDQSSLMGKNFKAHVAVENVVC